MCFIILLSYNNVVCSSIILCLEFLLHTVIDSCWLAETKVTRWSLRVTSVHGGTAPLPFIKSVEVETSFDPFLSYSPQITIHSTVSLEKWGILKYFQFLDSNHAHKHGKEEYQASFLVFLPLMNDILYCIKLSPNLLPVNMCFVLQNCPYSSSSLNVYDVYCVICVLGLMSRFPSLKDRN